jgi:hypothetical protein
VKLPDSLKYINDTVFWLCTNLTSVTIGSGVTTIAGLAFLDCTRLTSVYFATNAPSFQVFAFSGDNNVTAYYLPGTTGWANFTTFTGIPTLLWLPLIQSSDASIGVQTNQFGFNINWASGQTVVVEACLDLANPVWQAVQTNTLTCGSSYFSDSQWTNYPGRFYRLRSP